MNPELFARRYGYWAPVIFFAYSIIREAGTQRFPLRSSGGDPVFLIRRDKGH
jgi:hypothetical protein